MATAAISCGIAVFLFLLLLEPSYPQEATFRQASKQSELSFNMKEIFQQFISHPSENAIGAVMHSKVVLRGVVEDLGMQAECKTDLWITGGLKRIWENLCAEFGVSPADRDRFVFSNVVYTGERPLRMFVKWSGNGVYQLFDRKKQLLAVGVLGEQRTFQGGHLTLGRVPKETRENRFYSLSIHPWEKVVGRLRKRLHIAPLKQDKNILKIQFRHWDRMVGADFVNRVMLGCQNYLKRENSEICQEQYRYIQKRQEELTKSFDLSLIEHVAYLKENLKRGGFAGFAQEVEMLSGPKTSYTSRLFDLDLELSRLHSHTDASSLASSFGDSDREKEKKERSDGERENKVDFPGMGESRQINSRLESCILEQQRYEASLCAQGNGAPLQLSRVVTEEESGVDGVSGLSLETAQELLVEYTRQRDSIQAQVRELVFLREQMDRFDFEMSSLCGVIDDGVTKDIVNKASTISLQLKDENNRSQREQERLQEALGTQKSFLSHHLLQTCDLKRLRIKLLGDKISSLQQQTLSLLATEKGLLGNKLGELNEKMGDLPEKWRRESLLLLKKELGAAMIEGISQLAETKSLSQHMFQVSSRPLDRAFPPLKLQSKHLFLLSCISALLAGACCYLFVFCRALYRGLPVSEETLKILGFQVSGTLSRHCHTPLAQMRDQDLETLRRIAAPLVDGRGPVTAVCIGGKYPDYSRSLAELLAMRGMRTLVIQCAFDQVVHRDEIPGLWQYLHGQETTLPIRRHLAYDVLPAGGTSRHGPEMISGPRFQRLLAEVGEKYDVVLICSTSGAATVEGYSMLPLADMAIITVQQEKREELAVYQKWAQQKGGACATFVFAGE